MHVRKLLLLILVLLVTGGFCVLPVAATPTTQLHIVKFANDNTTILNETTVDFEWMMANLPVYGDGTTHYYHQGPNSTDSWNVNENDPAILTKDMGAVKGTNLQDLCDLVGGMSADDQYVKLLSPDGFNQRFAYSSVYAPPARAGPIVITWYKDGNFVNGTYSSGMRNVMFADASVNPWGYHVFGLYDMNQSYPAGFQYFYEGNPSTPSTTGLSVQMINRVYIYSSVPAPSPTAPGAAFSATPLSGSAPLAVQFTDASTGTGPLTYAWDFNNDMGIDNTTQNPLYTYPAPGTYTVNLTVTNSVGSDSEVKSSYISVTSAPTVDTLYDGTVTLTPNETFTKQAYNNLTGGLYTINRTTPLGALDKVATLQGFAYNVTDSRWTDDQVLMLDDIGQYLRKKPNYWYAYVNGEYKDGYQNHPNGLNVIELSNNDQVNFYYAPNKDPNPVVNATAVVKIKVNISVPGPAVHTIYDGEARLIPGETFNVTSYLNPFNNYTVNRTTPLGALDKVAASQGLALNISDKRWSSDQVLLLDDLGPYLYKKPNIWYAYVNGVYKDGYGNHANGLNVIELAQNDQVNFYYAPNKDPNPVINATDVVKIRVNTTAQPSAPDWTLSLSGAKNTTVSKTLFEEGLACPSSGHQVFWTDADTNVWGGVPLWVLVSMVDDNPDVGPDHFNFNDSVAAQGYSVKVISGDGWDTTLSSADIARNDSFIVANTLNGQPLPRNTTAGKLSWPLHLKGAAVFGGQQVGNITSIELTGLPEPETGWTLSLEGDVTDVITQSYFIEAIACHHNVTWTDSGDNVWEGVALWDLVGAVDDIETSSHFTFNDTRAATNYTIRVSAADGFNATFKSSDVANNDGYFVAYKMNGAPLTGSNAPLKLVGPSTKSGKERVGNISFIRLEGLPDQYPAGNWQLMLKGKISDSIPQGEFEYWAWCHNASYTDSTGNVYTGIPLWRLMGWVDDRIPHGQNGFDDAGATAGYKVIVKAGDGYAKEFTSTQIGKTNNYIVANTMNGAPLPTDGSHPPYPLRLVGSNATGGNSVGNIAEIELTDFQVPVEVPELHIIKYGSDGTTVINETYVDYNYMESNLPVIGDGTTVYKFEGLTLNPSNVWDPEETYPGGFKVSNAVKGTRIHDLAELVGGMGSGTTITFVASDGFESTLPYSNIYTNPAVQERQGDAIIAWWGDGQYVPLYGDGMRLFFTPGGDHVYGQWDMHETLPSAYWRYNFQDGIQYPSAAGLSAKYITTIKVYSTPESEWTLELDGRDIGGLNYTVSKPFLEEAIACQFGADHKATYTDSKDRVWEGMPLWFFAGFVDDADQHSVNAFNSTLAMNGYRIIVTAADGYNTTIDSREMIRSPNFIVANSLNGTHIDEADENWPLRLTGANVSGSRIVKGVKSIRLTSTVIAPEAAFTADPLTGKAPLTVQFTDTSANSPTSWNWTFGDGDVTNATVQNPVHTYLIAGNYSVSLNVSNSGGNNTLTRFGYVNVTNAPARIGVFRPSTHLFYLDYNDNGMWNGAGVDRAYNFGLTGDIPVAGDWNNNGISEIGVFRPSTHLFYLDYNGNGMWNGAGVDRAYNFGLTGDIPTAGDWNNDGISEIGVFRPSTHLFYLDYNGNGMWNGAGVDRAYNFGLTGDIPTAGDWNNDGISEIGVFRPSTHLFYLDYNGNGMWNGAGVDRAYNFGLTGDIPTAGDWNNDGISEIGVFRNSTHVFNLDYNGNGIWNGAGVDRAYNFGLTGDKPIDGIWG